MIISMANINQLEYSLEGMESIVRLLYEWVSLLGSYNTMISSRYRDNNLSSKLKDCIKVLGLFYWRKTYLNIDKTSRMTHKDSLTQVR